ncbi:MAG TPA: type II toxin-antitoxin system RelE/ParE family toxin [Tepidisphaeraceae bacterium]|nr:type II toxin-antitoxin system RelE/ParE family toxin [Tepidisphaeraceae bacterium]
MWEVLVTDTFQRWWNALSDDEQSTVLVSIELLRQLGPKLPRPHADTVKGSRHANMKELRSQHRGKPYRTLFAFDPGRRAVLLCGGDKTGDGRFYRRMIPLADRLFDEHLASVNRKRQLP